MRVRRVTWEEAKALPKLRRHDWTGILQQVEDCKPGEVLTIDLEGMDQESAYKSLREYFRNHDYKDRVDLYRGRDGKSLIVEPIRDETEEGS